MGPLIPLKISQNLNVEETEGKKKIQYWGGAFSRWPKHKGRSETGKSREQQWQVKSSAIIEMAVANGRARSWDQQLPSNFLPLQGKRRLQLVQPLDLFFKFSTTTSSLPFRSTQIGILKRTCKGHFCV